MGDQSLITLLLTPLSALLLAMPVPFAARAEEGQRISEPIVHDNLAIYFIKGKSQDGPVPLTLDEALAKGTVKVHETSQVSELQIENTGDEDVFVHAGDIVKGGQQDRVLSLSIIVPPKSGRVPIASFCVERGRWSARGKEDVRTFASSKDFIPSLEGKKAMRSAQKAEAARVVAAARAPADAARAAPNEAANAEAALERRVVEQQRQQEAYDRNNRYNSPADGPLPRAPDSQGDVWRSVEAVQSSLGASLNGAVTASVSETSLQLALENEKLMKAQAAYVDALKPQGESDGDVIGLVVAVNGELKSADIYPSNGLFKKVWAKHLKAAATEAIAKREQASAAMPATADVEAFLDDAKKGETHEQKLNDALKLEVSEGAKTEAFASRAMSGALLHMNLLKK